jgi:hypothetical protein
MNAKTTTEKKSAIGSVPDFVTAHDLAHASVFETEFKRLLRHRNAFSRVPVKEKLEHAKSAYLESPTDENFEIVKTLATELVVIEAPGSSYGNIRSIVHGFIGNHLIRERILPWARALVERGLTKARANLTDVIACEEAHHFEVTGEPLSAQQSTPIIEKARRPVRELENVLASLQGEDEHAVMSFIHFLRAQASKRGAN